MSGRLLAFKYDLEPITCANCGISFAVASEWVGKKERDHSDFYCPNGHKLHFPGESRQEKAERLRKAAEREAERQRYYREKAEGSARAYKGHLTRVKRRVGKGVCPCCNRTFKNLADHMETKHPEYAEGES